MQLYARDSQNKIIFAGHAAKQTNYTCIECAQLVRLRSGLHRQAHFYHLRPNEACAQYGKSMTHLMLQCHLQEILPPGEAQLECRFAAINRIADVVWHKQKLVFEIQCSPITAQEINARNRDYASAGYQVVWILHDNRFNQWHLSAAEHTLSDWPHYFTNRNGEGQGEIYEQLSINLNGTRKERLPKLTVDLSTPQRGDFDDLTLFPKLARQKIESYPVSFEGDTIDHCMHYSKSGGPLTDYLQSISAAELRHSSLETIDFSSLPLTTFIKILWKRYFVQPYCALLRLFLERACK